MEADQCDAPAGISFISDKVLLSWCPFWSDLRTPLTVIQYICLQKRYAFLIVFPSELPSFTWTPFFYSHSAAIHVDYMDKCCRPLYYYQLLFTLMLSFLNLLLMFLIPFCPHFFQILFGLELEFWKHSKKKKTGRKAHGISKESIWTTAERATTGWSSCPPMRMRWSFSFDWDDRHLRYYEDRTTWSAQFSLGATMLF